MFDDASRSVRPHWADRLRVVRRAIRGLEVAQVTRFGGSIVSAVFRTPVLVITTTGRQTARRRSTVTAYHRLASGELAVVGGAGGQRRVPDWVANLRAHPVATVTVDRRTWAVRARELTGTERARRWDELVAVWPRIATYERRAGYPIAVFTLASLDEAAPATLTPGTTVRVCLVKLARPSIEYDMQVVADDGDHVVVEGPWSGPEEHDLGFVRLGSGDHFIEHFWRGRWYSVKEIIGPDGNRKGWYCDVTRPTVVEHGQIVSVDLELDLWVSADGRRVLALDEHEFAASGLTETDPAAAGEARAALRELQRLAAEGFRSLAPRGQPRPPRAG